MSVRIDAPRPDPPTAHHRQFQSEDPIARQPPSMRAHFPAPCRLCWPFLGEPFVSRAIAAHFPIDRCQETWSQPSNRFRQWTRHDVFSVAWSSGATDTQPLEGARGTSQHSDRSKVPEICQSNSSEYDNAYKANTAAAHATGPCKARSTYSATHS